MDNLISSIIPADTCAITALVATCSPQLDLTQSNLIAVQNFFMLEANLEKFLITRNHCND